jgi:hypothetical protein
MTKMIEVKKCGDCRYFAGKQTCTKLTDKIIDLDTVHKNCPLPDMPDIKLVDRDKEKDYA